MGTRNDAAITVRCVIERVNISLLNGSFKSRLNLLNKYMGVENSKNAVGDAGMRIFHHDAMIVSLIKRGRCECRNSGGKIVAMGRPGR